MTPLAALLILSALAAISGIAGVFLLFGPGWALIALSVALATGAASIRQGLKAGE